MKNKKGEDGDRDSGSEDEGTGYIYITNIYLASKLERQL